LQAQPGTRGFPAPAQRMHPHHRGKRAPDQGMDSVHCPPRTPHAIIAAGAEPALDLAVGAGKEKGRRPLSRRGGCCSAQARVPDALTSPTDVMPGLVNLIRGPAPEIF
jgi:hypothetical protein